MQSRESFQDLVASLDTSEPVALRDWSAQQFSLMYVRFRPLLVEHAKRFVGNEQLAEEITQDAFLYLMTSLPELDSELGVLRFLKWKTKMLCMDVTRGRVTKGGSHLELNEDFLIDTSEPVDQLERADDAAVVQLALAKLSPRHRDVLVKTIFEEKSHDEVASQMGLSTNALRQLIYRARHSFKVALVGEAEVAGKSVTDILTIAARRALTSKIAPSIALILALSLSSLAFWSSWRSPVQTPSIASANSVRDVPSLKPAEEVQALGPQEEIAPQASGGDGDIQASPIKITKPPGDLPSSSVAGDVDPSTVGASKAEEALMSADLDRRAAEAVFDVSLLSRLTTDEISTSSLHSDGTELRLEITTEQGIMASFSLSNSHDAKINFAWFELTLDDHTLALIPQSISQVSFSSTGEKQCQGILFSEFVVGDLDGSLGSVAFSEGVISRNAAHLSYCISNDNQISEPSLLFSNKS